MTTQAHNLYFWPAWKLPHYEQPGSVYYITFNTAQGVVLSDADKDIVFGAVKFHAGQKAQKPGPKGKLMSQTTKETRIASTTIAMTRRTQCSCNAPLLPMRSKPVGKGCTLRARHIPGPFIKILGILLP